MVVGNRPDHSDHDQAFTNLLQTAQMCNVKLNYDKLQYTQNEGRFLWWELYNKWLQASQKQGVSYSSHDFTNPQKTSPVVYWHG